MSLLLSVPEPVYVVGGSVRDALRDVPGADLDLAVQGSAIKVSRWLADQMGGALYIMDMDHDVARIILAGGQAPAHIDLAGLRGGSIEEDLGARDLTINAMGMRLTDPLGPLLDPTGGLADMQQGIIRHAYPEAFRDDPARLLRAVRLCAALEQVLHPSTRAAIFADRKLLRLVSAERLRDELFQMLALPSVRGLSDALELGLLETLFPQVTPETLDAGIKALAAWHEMSSHATGPAGLLIGEMEHVQESGHSRLQLVSLAALLSPATEHEAEAVVGSLRLSTRESVHVSRMLAALRDGPWSSAASPGAVECHRYFRTYGPAGADAAALVLALEQPHAATRESAQQVVRVWVKEQRTVVAPHPLLTGQDLVVELGLSPGPVVSAILRALSEAQVQGEIVGRADALGRAREVLVDLELTQRQV